MDFSSVNTLGVIVFSCAKFGGYVLAFVLLKRMQPAIQTNSFLMAGARTALGLIVGGALYFAWDAARHQFSGFYNFSDRFLPYYFALSILRFFVWAAVIYIFSKRINLPLGRVCLYALAGSLWSDFMDIPAALFTFLTPGAVYFC
jgi:hypothetical protein